MRDLFPGYYPPTENELKEIWKECIFTFDTNILLHIYRYTPKARERFFDILNKLRDRIWVPYQVAFEYQKERDNAIRQRLKGYETLLSEKSKYFSNFKASLDKYAFLNDEDKSTIQSVLEEAEQKIENIIENDKLKNESVNFDEIRDCLDEILGDNIGTQYTLEQSKLIYKQAEERFNNKIPPGYEDNKKPVPEKYGDFIIWRQLIDYAKSCKKALIFVTDDKKEDWWLIREGQRKGVRPELVQEMKSEASIVFHMYSNDKFMEYAEQFFNLPHEQEIIDEARDIHLENKEQEVQEYNINEYLPSTKVSNLDIVNQPINQIASQLAQIKKHELDIINQIRKQGVEELIISKKTAENNLIASLDIMSKSMKEFYEHLPQLRNNYLFITNHTRDTLIENLSILKQQNRNIELNIINQLRNLSR